MNTGKYIYGQLSGDATVSALVSTRIFPIIAPQEIQYPLIVYSVDNKPLDNNMKDKASYHDQALVTINIWAEVNFGQDAYTELDSIDTAVRDALDFVSATKNGVTCEMCKYLGSEDIYSEDRLLLGRSCTYRMTIKND